MCARARMQALKAEGDELCKFPPETIKNLSAGLQGPTNEYAQHRRREEHSHPYHLQQHSHPYTLQQQGGRVSRQRETRPRSGRWHACTHAHRKLRASSLQSDAVSRDILPSRLVRPSAGLNAEALEHVSQVLSSLQVKRKEYLLAVLAALDDGDETSRELSH